MTTADQSAIDALIRAFFSAFTNVGGVAPPVHLIFDVFVPDGRIINATGPAPQILDLAAFIAPRQKILTDGTLTDFEEKETSSHTEIFGNIATRLSAYEKRGVLRGEPFEGRGRKSTQLIRTPDGWRMVSLAWDDEPA